MEGILPIKVNLTIPKDIPAGVPVPLNVEVQNPSDQNLKGLMLHQLEQAPCI